VGGRRLFFNALPGARLARLGRYIPRRRHDVIVVVRIILVVLQQQTVRASGPAVPGAEVLLCAVRAVRVRTVVQLSFVRPGFLHASRLAGDLLTGTLDPIAGRRLKVVRPFLANVVCGEGKRVFNSSSHEHNNNNRVKIRPRSSGDLPAAVYAYILSTGVIPMTGQCYMFRARRNGRCSK